MAIRISNGTGGGNWSAGASWQGGVAPVNGDITTIQAGDTITVDTPGCACGLLNNDSALVLNGTLKWSRAASSDLTVAGSIAYIDGSVFDMGTAASPIPLGVTAKLILGRGNSAFHNGLALRGGFSDPTTGGATARGAARARVVTLTGAVAAGANVVCPVSDATGWQIGDLLLFPQTTSNAAYEIEVATITAIAGLNVTVNTLGFSHAANCKIGNLTSNVIITSFSTTTISAMMWNAGEMPDGSIDFQDVEFLDIGSDPNSLGAFMIQGSNTVPSLNAPAILKNCSFYRTSGLFGDGCMAGGFQNVNRPFVIDTCVMYAPINNGVGVWFSGSYGSGGQATAKDCLICTPVSFGGYQAGQTVSNCFCSTNGDAMISYGYLGNKATFENCTLSGRGIGVTYGTASGPNGPMIFNNCDLGSTFGYNQLFGDKFMRGVNLNLLVNVLVKDCKLNAAFTDPTENPDTHMINANPASSFIYSNKNNDPTKHEFWGAGGQILRDDGFTFDGSSPTWKFRPLNALVPLTRAFQVLAPYNGANPTLTVVSGWIYREAGVGASKVTLSGLGIVPNVYTCTKFAQWEQFVVFATQTQGSSGVLDVTVEIGLGAGTPNAWVANVSAPLAVAADTGKFNFWYLGQPVPLVMSNNVGAIDVMNVLLSQLTLPNSVGKAIAEMFRVHGLELGTPLVVTRAARTAGAGISQTVADNGAQVTVTRS